MRHQARDLCVPSEAWPTPHVIDGAVSINPPQSRQDDTLLHVNTKTLILVFTGIKEGGEPADESPHHDASNSKRDGLR